MRLTQKPKSPLARERAIKLMLIVAALLAVGAWVAIDLVVEPRLEAAPGRGHDWFGLDLVHFTEGVLFAVLAAIGPLWLLFRRNAQLRAAQQDLTQTAEGARAGYYRWDIRADRVRGWGSLRGAFGLPTPAPGDFPGAAWLAMVHPEDLDRYKATVAAHLKGDTDRMVVDYRVRRGDGGEMWVREKAAAQRDGAGRAVTLAGTIEDVTERKTADLALREAHARINAFANAGSDWFWETDADHRITFVTERYTEIAGITAAKALGKSRRELAGAAQIERDKAKWSDFLAKLDRREPFRDFQYELTGAGGRAYTVSINGVPVFDDAGAFVGYRGTGTDVTAQRRAQRELAEREAQLRAIFENAPIGIALKDLDGRIIEANPQAFERLGIAAEAAIGRKIDDIVTPELAAAYRDHDRATLEAGEAIAREANVSTPVGPRDLRHVRFPVRDGDGTITGLGLICDDITERKRIENALRESEERNRLALSANNSSIWEWDIAGGTVLRTPRCAEIMGLGPEELDSAADWWLDQIHPDDLAGYKAAIRAHLKGETERFECTYRVRSKDGGLRWLRDRGLAQRDDDGRARRMTGSVEDITDNKNIADALERTRAALRGFIENAPLDITLKDAEGRYLLFNRSGCRHFGVTAADVVGKTVSEVMPEAMARAANAQERELLATQRPVYADQILYTPEGDAIELSQMRFPIVGDDGTCFGIGVVGQDVTEARRAERMVRSQKEQLHAMADALPAMIVHIDGERRIGFVNRVAERWWGRRRDEVVGQPISVVPSEAHYRRYAPFVERAFAGEEVSLEVEMDCADGKTRQLDRRYVPHRDETGAVVGVYGMSIDVTEQRASEEKLRHSQKMEAVGNLTGGIAHDFNNLMLAVQGNLEFLEEELAPENDVQRLRFVRNARKGVTRAADLTARLLAFSHRQALRPESVDIVALFDEFRELVRRALPESLVIETEVNVDGCRLLIDAGQLDNALLNLAINARDAMPEGGTLTFRIERVEVDAGRLRPETGAAPGPHLRIQVVDTGTGMPPEIIERAFEPFFTTKDVGHGTGLGLSMVHGFVEQSGGFVEIDSVPGVGTTVSLYLPVAADAAPAPEDAAADDGAEAAPKACGNVLLAEDDEMVRDVAARYLANLGYAVVPAADAAEALGLIESGRGFDLLLSDVMMPGRMTGVALAEAAARARPGLEVILMTGNADASALLADTGAGNVAVLRKPFTQADLAAAVAAALGRGVTARSQVPAPAVA